MHCVGNAIKYVERSVGSRDRWQSVPGRDTESSVFIVDDAVVKTREMSKFEAANLSRILDDVHKALSCLYLVPRVRWHCFDGQTMASVFDHIPRSEAIVNPFEVGQALARAHRALTGVKARGGETWAGFYGEYHEFAMTTAAVDDNELRELGLRLLPHARRAEVPGPCHYVHRDLHPGNVLATGSGLCLVDWDLAHAGSAVDDLAMTALLWAADLPGFPCRVAEDVLAGYSNVASRGYILSDPEMRTAIALAGLRQGIAAWYTDQGDCSAAYWPFVRRRTRVAVGLVTGTD